MIKKEDIKKGLEFCVKTYDPGSNIVGYRNEHGKPIVYRVECQYITMSGEYMVECEGRIAFPLSIFTDNGFSKRNKFQLAVYAKDAIQEAKELDHGPLEVEVDDEGVAAFSQILKKMIDTYVVKNHDYGNAFSEIYDELGFNYAYGKIREKVNRIKTLKDKEANVKGEPLEDALLDCANYCILTLVEYQKRKGR